MQNFTDYMKRNSNLLLRVQQFTLLGGPGLPAKLQDWVQIQSSPVQSESAEQALNATSAQKEIETWQGI